MLPGPNQIISCPHCKALGHYRTLMSGNTFGAKTYSDGKQVAPHLPQPPTYIECHSCHKTYWLQDAEEIGTVPWSCSPGDDFDPAWISAPLVQSPSEERFYQVIEESDAVESVEAIIQLRTLAWHKRNDLYREDNTRPFEVTDAARENMRDLSLALGNGCKAGGRVDLDVGLSIAELVREQGHFDYALEYLEKNNWRHLQFVADQLAELCRQKISRVVELSIPR